MRRRRDDDAAAADDDLSCSLKRKRDFEEDNDLAGGLSLTTIMKENPELSVKEALTKLQLMKQMALPDNVRTYGEIPEINISYLLGPGESQMLATAAAQQEAASLQKAERELYVKDFPIGMNAQELNEFLTYCLGFICERLPRIKCHLSPIVTTWLSIDQRTAFLECRGEKDAEILLLLNGRITLNNIPLKIGRPKSNPLKEEKMLLPKTGSNSFILLNLPRHLTSEQILTSLLLPFGEIEYFNLLCDQAQKSKGVCIFKFVEENKNIFKILNNLQLGDETIQMQRVPFNMLPTLLQRSRTQLEPVAPYNPSQPTNILCLRNIVKPSDVLDDQAYADLTDDVLEEASKYAQVESIEIPRIQGILHKYTSSFSKKDKAKISGLGLCFIEFSDDTAASKALSAFRTRSFDDFDIDCHFYPRDLYEKRIFHSEPVPMRLLEEGNNAPFSLKDEHSVSGTVKQSARIDNEPQDGDPLFSPHAPIYVPPKEENKQSQPATSSIIVDDVD
mmetsp:Transcript_8150/g.11350  ORF Transcript_8150/g.11350 Transcript_8150/m.11350 type:complete len:504 (-) Transcript_8150:90-1601(-)